MLGPVDAGAGRGVYAYHQEGDDPEARDDDFSNQALMENLRQQLPVAVLIQKFVLAQTGERPVEEPAE